MSLSESNVFPEDSKVLLVSEKTLQKIIEVTVRKELDGLKKLLTHHGPQREFLTPKEFCALTGDKYSSVIYRCKIGRLRAVQDGPGCVWKILASEVERLKQEAGDIDVNS